VIAALEPLADTATTLATAAERAFSRTLSGSCRTPLAAYGSWQEGALWLRGLIASPDGHEVMRAEAEATIADIDAAEAMGIALAEGLIARGAARFIVAA
jgi:hydroxymethylbilane synthase